MRTFVSVLALCATAVAAAPTCEKLSNVNSKLWSDIVQVFGETQTAPIRGQLVNVMNMLNFSPLDKCLGSIDLPNAYPTIAPILNERKCTSALNYFTGQDIKEFTDGFSKVMENPMTNVVPFVKWLREVHGNRYNILCNTVEGTLAPCMVQTVLPIVMEVLEKFTNGCCVDLFSQTDGLLGDSIDNIVTEALMALGNGICARRSPGVVNGNHETCGQTLVNTIITPNLYQMIYNVLHLAEMPTPVACDAMMGLDFKNTRDKTVSFYNDPIDSCSINFDQLFSFIYSMPVIKSLDINGFKANDLFEDGKCVDIDHVLQFLPEKYRKLVKLVLKERCFHFANGGYHSECAYVSTLRQISRPAKPTPAPTQYPTQAPTQTPTTAPTQAPTTTPTQYPTQAPTTAPTQAPTTTPTQYPTQAPTNAPTTTPAPCGNTPAPTTTPAPSTPTPCGTTPAPTTPAPCGTQVPTPAPTTAKPCGNTPAPSTPAPCGNTPAPTPDATTCPPLPIPDTPAPTSKPTPAPTPKPTTPAPATGTPGPNLTDKSAAAGVVVTVLALIVPALVAYLF